MDLQEVGWRGTDRPGSGQAQVVGICECGYELSGSIKCGEFLDQLFTKNCARWSQLVSYALLSVRPHLDTSWTDFYEIIYLGIL